MLNDTFLHGGPTFAGSIFPFVFICIMCGAISGFHALVSNGTTPNNWNIELDLAAMSIPFTYDPTSASPNLLLDINCPTAPSNAASPSSFSLAAAAVWLAKPVVTGNCSSLVVRKI